MGAYFHRQRIDKNQGKKCIQDLPTESMNWKVLIVVFLVQAVILGLFAGVLVSIAVTVNVIC